MITVVITAYKEAKTIRATIRSILDRPFSGYDGKLKLVVVAPDSATLRAAQAEALAWDNSKLQLIEDKGTGKPAALNSSFKVLEGDITIFTDGDVSLSKGSVGSLVKELKAYPQLGGVSGRQHSINNKATFWGYTSHLFTEALDHARKPLLGGNTTGGFFPLSGYVMAVRTELLDFTLPEDVLVDDAYISYKIVAKGKKVGYTPEAAAYVKYPTNFGDYFKQKVRSTGGYLQLVSTGVMPEDLPSRTFSQDLKMILFPIRYARSPKQILFSVLQYPLRLLLWLKIYWLKTFSKESFTKSWKRVESTK